MCLLVHQPASTVFSDEFLLDVYSSNRDGIGVMFADGGELRVLKALPSSGPEFVRFYRDHIEGRESVWHARMQTHGDIDLENCHPYAVTDRVALAHNGILATGNDWDKSRSDTWHFIRNIVRPALLADESLAACPTWQSFIGDLIGRQNKFGVMTASGAVSIINRASGLEFEGAWLSNTYAWSAAKFGVGIGKPSRYVTAWDSYDWETSGYSGRVWAPPSRAASSPSGSLVAITRAARNSYVRGALRRWVEDAPAKAAALVDAIEGDQTRQAGAVAYSDPELAFEVIEDWFANEEGLSPSDNLRSWALD